MVEYSRSSGHRLRLGEVTITELNFFRLRQFWTQGVYITTSEPDEARTGADWEWLIGHGEDWVQIRVQAKIINKAGSFPHLGHPNRTRAQMDNLIAPHPNTQLCRWMPLYIFYTAAPPARNFPTPDKRGGCSARLAEQVRATYGVSSPPATATLTAAKHLPGSRPWSNIFAGLVAQLAAGRDLASIIGALANEAFPAPSTFRTVDQFWDPRVSGGRCAGGLAPYAQAILERRDDDFNDAGVSQLVVRTPNDAPLDLITNAANGIDELPSIPARVWTLDTPEAEAERTALPRFVAVIDIDRLPVG